MNAPRDPRPSSSNGAPNRSRPPTVPWIESDGLDAYLASIGADVETAAIARSLRDDGYAVVELGPDAERLCEAAAAQTEPYFQPGKSRVQDVWRRSPAVRDLACLPRLGRL